VKIKGAKYEVHTLQIFKFQGYDCKTIYTLGLKVKFPFFSFFEKHGG
jgi:hypothetical protein